MTPRADQELHARRALEDKRLNDRRQFEDQAADLGRERARVQGQLDENTEAIYDLLREAHYVVPLEDFAKLTGVSRPTLYRMLKSQGQEPVQPTK